MQVFQKVTCGITCLSRGKINKYFTANSKLSLPVKEFSKFFENQLGFDRATVATSTNLWCLSFLEHRVYDLM